MMSIWFLLNGALLIWALWNVIESLAVHTTYYHFLFGFTDLYFYVIHNVTVCSKLCMLLFNFLRKYDYFLITETVFLTFCTL